MTKLIAFRATDQDQQMIEAERARLVEYHNGAPITLTHALRSLMGTAKEAAAA